MISSSFHRRKLMQNCILIELLVFAESRFRDCVLYLPVSSTSIQSSIPEYQVFLTLHKGPVSQVCQRLIDFFFRIHDERTIGDNGLLERCSCY